MKKIEYPFTIRRLSKAEGGGWLVEFPDLPDASPMEKRSRKRWRTARTRFAPGWPPQRSSKTRSPLPRWVKREMGPAGSQKPSRQACRQGREGGGEFEHTGRFSHRRRVGTSGELTADCPNSLVPKGDSTGEAPASQAYALPAGSPAYRAPVRRAPPR